ncbi:adenylyltransferase/cytidyltransferase family protein [Paraglaciecola psychrophila]|uniref:Cytidyltransferase-related domain-containing protein n=1 Tax=Paraglaciecola psychrophila 170 TaxID=1129794 RepID=K7AQJ3_9ALTE|nr:adenylyltransferase/cytidyltransferase family protein [Paraglaciecola psychrophila]AGH45790.1 cytidyltransferase-related domain-containing protein [Paraglaciecola psychrophila 170]GAC37585.1 glycerol-3-phosphate cytidylyltransferase [Paraglaciecola psychrophila 170]
MKTVITYGTFDLLHVGHVNMLERLADLGGKLIVGVSTDEFNLLKGKHSVYSYAERAKIVSALRCVDQVIAEHDWQQKKKDIEQYQIDIFGIGADWQGKFDELSANCEVVYLPRTPSISTTDLKKALSKIDSAAIQQIKLGLDSVLNIVKAIE